MNPITNNQLIMPDYKKKNYVGMPIKEWVLRYAAIQMVCSDKTVLDVGGKFGYGAIFLSQWAKRVVVSDVKNQTQDDIEFIKADWTKDLNGSFEEKFDVVNCMEVLEHVKNPERIVKNCASVVKDNGIFSFTTPCVDRHIESHLKPFFTGDEIHDLIDPYFDFLLFKPHMGVSWFGICKHKGVL